MGRTVALFALFVLTLGSALWNLFGLFENIGHLANVELAAIVLAHSWLSWGSGLIFLWVYTAPSRRASCPVLDDQSHTVLGSSSGDARMGVGLVDEETMVNNFSGPHLSRGDDSRAKDQSGNDSNATDRYGNEAPHDVSRLFSVVYDDSYKSSDSSDSSGSFDSLASVDQGDDHGVDHGDEHLDEAVGFLSLADVYELLLRSVASWKLRLGARSPQIHLSECPQEPDLKGEFIYFKQKELESCLESLLALAVESVGDAPEGLVRLSLRIKSENLSLVIEDNGSGLSERMIAKREGIYLQQKSQWANGHFNSRAWATERITERITEPITERASDLAAQWVSDCPSAPSNLSREHQLPEVSEGWSQLGQMDRMSLFQVRQILEKSGASFERMSRLGVGSRTTCDFGLINEFRGHFLGGLSGDSPWQGASFESRQLEQTKSNQATQQLVAGASFRPQMIRPHLVRPQSSRPKFGQPPAATVEPTA